jgi:hypothetical protein
MGNHWRIQYSNIKVSLDGEAIRFEEMPRGRDMLLRISPAATILGYEKGEHTLRFEYLASNDVRRGDGWDTLTKSFGGGFRIERLNLHILFPRGVDPAAAQLDAATDITPTSSNCACKIERRGNQIDLEVTRPLKLGETLSFELRFKTGALHRSLRQRIELLHQNNRSLYGWSQFLSSLLFYYFVAFTAIKLQNATVSGGTRRSLLTVSMIMALGSVLLSGVLNQPNVALPGTFLGIIGSMVLGGGIHGPSNRYLWVPFAIAVNCCFYYLLWRLLQMIAKMRVRSQL